MDLIWCQKKNMKGVEGRTWERKYVNRVLIYEINKNSKFKK